jgi:hypothetical protein
MKKPLTLLFLSLSIACSAWAEKYEYVRIFGGQEPITLESGDIAWFVNSDDPFGTSITQYDLDLNVISSQKRFHSSGNDYPKLDSTFVGPCILGCSREGTFVTLKILRVSESGNKTLEWDGEKYAGTTTTDSNDDGSQNANNNSSSGGIDPSSIKYDELLGWTWLTDTNWVYSYTNLSWYYMHSVGGDIYVWNANLPDNGWQKLERG